MTTPARIPFLVVEGSHREAGRSLGEAQRAVIQSAVDFGGELPEGRTMEAQLTLAQAHLDVTAAALPWFVEELEGMAEGAGVDPLALFAVDIEEIWGDVRPGDAYAVKGRCSDLVAAPPATAGGHVLVAHNNDMGEKYEDDLVAVEWRVTGDPVAFSIGNGVWISTGWNEAGLSLTGNELTPNDMQVGVPREVQVRAMLRTRSLEDTVDEALRPNRASSYNNLLSWSDGSVVNVEGSATDAELTQPNERGHLVHTNHYVCDRMLGFEGDPGYATRSATRYRRASELLERAPEGSITEDGMREMLSDHETAPDALCRHPEPGSGDSKTCFWCVVDVTDRRVTYGRGNPCNSQAQHYAFA